MLWVSPQTLLTISQRFENSLCLQMSFHDASWERSHLSGCGCDYNGCSAESKQAISALQEPAAGARRSVWWPMAPRTRFWPLGRAGFLRPTANCRGSWLCSRAAAPPWSWLWLKWKQTGQERSVECSIRNKRGNRLWEEAIVEPVQTQGSSQGCPGRRPVLTNIQHNHHHQRSLLTQTRRLRWLRWPTVALEAGVLHPSAGQRGVAGSRPAVGFARTRRTLFTIGQQVWSYWHAGQGSEEGNRVEQKSTD